MRKDNQLLYKSPYLHGELLKKTLRGGKVEVLAFLEDEETGEKYVKFSFLDELKNEVIEQTVARNELNPRKLQQIMLKSGGINRDAKLVFEEFQDAELFIDILKKKCYHNSRYNCRTKRKGDDYGISTGNQNT